MPLDLKNIPHLSTLEQYLTGDARRFTQPMNPADSPFLSFLRDRVMIFDGAMGTQIFAADLPLSDFWGKENCTDVLVLSRPDVIEDIHARYFAAGFGLRGNRHLRGQQAGIGGIRPGGPLLRVEP